MAHFHDLTPYQYGRSEPEQNVLNVGWLDSAMPYAKGETTEEFKSALAALCAKPMRLFRGSHRCQFCSEAIEGGRMIEGRWGNGEIRVRQGATWYVAPKLIAHYVSEHGYKPPDDFIITVLAPEEVGTDQRFPC